FSLLFLRPFSHHRYPRSFPTRRSSDLKTGELAFVSFGPAVDSVLRSRPSVGPLFPYLRTVRAGDRATEFKQRCSGLNISGISLQDRKSTRLNSSHQIISYAVFCLKKKK